MDMRRSALAGLALLLGVAADTRASGTLTPIAAGLDQPVYVTHAGDASGRLFIVELAGRVKLLRAGTLTTFLDIRSRVRAGGELGLLGLAFHPDFAHNRRFFVYYVRASDGASKIAEYHADPANPNVAETTETPILVTPQTGFTNHKGGQLAFGPDGKLYLGLGDGGSANDPDDRAQDLNDPLGKLLRIDVDAAVPYAVPADNPFAGATPGLDEIFAYGLRNPYRFSFDRAGGALFLGDVGQSAREEINVIVSGRNYGWRVLEGTQCTGLGPASCTDSQFVPPVLEYDHTLGRCSVTGGYAYRGLRGSLRFGDYVFGDFCSGEIFTRRADGSSAVLLDSDRNISGFGEDEAGEVYVVGLGGTVDRLSDPEAGGFRGSAFVAAARLDATPGVQIVTGAGSGGNPRVRAFGADGEPRATSFFAYDSRFRGGVRVGACDFDRDGRDEIVTGTGPGVGPHVKIFKLASTGQPETKLANFYAFDRGFTGGVFVACGDVDGDGVPEVAVGKGEGGGPRVRVFRYSPQDPGGVSELASFLPYGPAFSGGVRVAVADVDGDGRADVVTGAGPGGAPQVRAMSLAGGTPSNIVDFLAYGAAFRGGVSVAAADLDADGKAEIVTGAGPGGGPSLRIFVPDASAAGGVHAGARFFPYPTIHRGGLRVAATDALHGGPRILAALAGGSSAQVWGFDPSGRFAGPAFVAY